MNNKRSFLIEEVDRIIQTKKLPIARKRVNVQEKQAFPYSKVAVADLEAILASLENSKRIARACGHISKTVSAK